MSTVDGDDVNHSILILDDEPKTQNDLRQVLLKDGFKVITSTVSLEGAQLALTSGADLIILGHSNFGHRRKETLVDLLNLLRLSSEIPIINLVSTPTELGESIKLGLPLVVEWPASPEMVQGLVMEQIRTTYRRKSIPGRGLGIDDELTPNFLLEIHCKVKSPLKIIYRGRRTISREGKVLFDLPQEKLEEMMDTGIDRLDVLQALGDRLYRTIFKKDFEIFGAYNHAVGDSNDPSILHHVFVSDRDLLPLPFEALLNEDDPLKFLILKSPLSRTISLNINSPKSPINPRFFEAMREADLPIRILVLNLGGRSSEDYVDEEALQLEENLPVWFSRQGINVNVARKNAGSLTEGQLKDLLHSCAFDILHVVGHGGYNKQDPQNSVLEINSTGLASLIQRRKFINAKELNTFLADSEVRFVFFNVCRGSSTGKLSQKWDQVFLGLADCAVLAGVPSVLGYRHNVNGKRALDFALNFYQGLAVEGMPERALHLARRKAFDEDDDDFIWLSSVLVHQLTQL